MKNESRKSITIRQIAYTCLAVSKRGDCTICPYEGRICKQVKSKIPYNGIPVDLIMSERLLHKEVIL